MSRLAFFLVIGLLGCGPRITTVRVTIPDLDGVETPIPGFIVSFLPYNRDSILAAMEAKAPTRPHTETLDSLFRVFREPFAFYLRLSQASSRVEQTRDSLRQKLDSATAVTDPGIRALDDSLGRLRPRLVEARAALDRVRDEVQPEISRLRGEVVRWRDSTFATYASTVQSRRFRFFANAVADTTDVLGWATIELTNGPWWATASSIDPADPNAEWYWNVRIAGDTVFLDPRTGRRRPRY